MAGSYARIMSVNCAHVIRARCTFDTSGIATGVEIGEIPSGSFVGGATVWIKTAFNAATTNVLVVGTTADDDGFVTSAGAAAGTTGFKFNLTGAQSGDTLTADTKVYLKYTQTGTAATTGEAVVLVYYYPHPN